VPVEAVTQIETQQERVAFLENDSRLHATQQEEDRSHRLDRPDCESERGRARVATQIFHKIGLTDIAGPQHYYQNWQHNRC